MSFEVAALIAIAASIVVAVGLRAIPSESRRAARRVLRAAGDELADGAAVRIHGVVRGGDDTLRSPLGETKCVAYQLVVIARAGRSPAGSLHTVERCVPFVLDAGELGRFAVEADRVLIDLPATPSRRWDFSTRNDVLRKLGLDHVNSAKSDLEETGVAVGATVTLAGTLVLGAPRAEYGSGDTRGRFTGVVAIGPSTPARSRAGDTA